MPIADPDDAVLSIIEGELLERQWLNELLAMVDQAPDESTGWLADRNRCRWKTTD